MRDHTHDTLVIVHDYILFCYAGPYAFYFRFMSSVLTDMYTHGYMTIICCIILHICNAFAFSTILLLQSNGYFCNVDDVEPYAGNSDYWSMIPYVFNMSIIS